MEKLEWKNDREKLKNLIPYEHNPRTLSADQYEQLKRSLEKFDLAEIPAIDADNKIVAGHQRIKILIEQRGPEAEIDIRRASRKLTEKEYEEYLIRSNKNTGDWDFDILANSFEIEDLKDWGFTDDNFQIGNEIKDFNMPEPSGEIEINEKEVDENIDTKNTCPSCGYEW